MTGDLTGSKLRSAEPAESNWGITDADRETWADPLRAYYEANGYVVVRELISPRTIDSLLQIYASEIVPSKTRFFRQNTNRYERNELSAHGYVAQSFLDIHAFSYFPHFARTALDIFCHRDLLATLSRITAAPSHNHGPIKIFLRSSTRMCRRQRRTTFSLG